MNTIVLPTLIVAIFMAISSSAFVVAPRPAASASTTSTTTALDAVTSRRSVFATMGVAMAGILAVTTSSSEPALAFQSPRYDDNIPEPSQMPTNGKVDLNGAFIGEYKNFPGMYPHAAGKIASNGPYKTVKDIYSIKGLTENDIKMFKKYENEFTVNPPGRMFSERINNRVST